MPERERFLARRALAAAPALAHERGGERNRGVKAAAARRTYEEVGVHGRGAARHGEVPSLRLALHTVENRARTESSAAVTGSLRCLGAPVRLLAPQRPPERRRDPSRTTQRPESSEASVRKPSLTLRWNRFLGFDPVRAHARQLRLLGCTTSLGEIARYVRGCRDRAICHRKRDRRLGAPHRREARDRSPGKRASSPEPSTTSGTDGECRLDENLMLAARAEH